VKGNDLHFYSQISPPASSFLGKAVFKRLDADAPNGIKIRLEFSGNSDFSSGGYKPHWVWLTAQVPNQRVPPRTFGQVVIDVIQRPLLHTANAGEVEWLWRLRPEDLEGIEQGQQDAAKSPRYFKVDVLGIIQVSEGNFTVTGQGNFEVPVSEWTEYLTSLGYGVPPSLSGLLAAGGASHPSWSEAEKRLGPARARLRAGEDYAALTLCLGEFEKLESKPYMAESWTPLMTGVPAQKQDGVAGLLAAHCTYLNKIGHHKDRQDRDSMGNLIEMPLNHWEAELALATSQVLLAYAIRLKG
jgi:hypothetical protein